MFDLDTSKKGKKDERRGLYFGLRGKGVSREHAFAQENSPYLIDYIGLR